MPLAITNNNSSNRRLEPPPGRPGLTPIGATLTRASGASERLNPLVAPPDSGGSGNQVSGPDRPELPETEQGRALLKRLEYFFSCKKVFRNLFVATETWETLERDILTHSITNRLKAAGVDADALVEPINALVEKMVTAKSPFDYTRMIDGLISKIVSAPDFTQPREIIERFSVKSYVRVADHQHGNAPAFAPSDRKQIAEALLYLINPFLPNEHHTVGTIEQRFAKAVEKAIEDPTLANQKAVSNLYPEYSEVASKFTPLFPSTSNVTAAIGAQDLAANLRAGLLISRPLGELKRDVLTQIGTEQLRTLDMIDILENLEAFHQASSVFEQKLCLERVAGILENPRMLLGITDRSNPVLHGKPVAESDLGSSVFPSALAGGLTNQGHRIPAESVTTGAFGLPGAMAYQETPYPSLSVETGAPLLGGAALGAVGHHSLRHTLLKAVGVAVGAVAATVAGYVGYKCFSSGPDTPIPPEVPPATALDQVAEQQAIIEALSLAPHNLPDGTWESSLEAIERILNQASDPQAPEVAELVAQVLRRDVSPTQLESWSDDFAEFDRIETNETPAMATPLRDKRSLGAMSEWSDMKVVGKIIEAVQSFGYRVDTDAADHQFFWQALQEELDGKPELGWLANASENDKTRWLSYTQMAGQRYERFTQTSADAQQRPLAALQTAFEQSGLAGDLEDYRVSYPVVVPGVGTSTSVDLTLAEACSAGTGFDPAQALGFRDGHPLAAAELARVRTLLFNKDCRTTPNERLAQLQARKPQLQADYAAFLEAELHRDVLEAKLKGHLSVDRGLEVAMGAIRGESNVEVGQLVLSTGQGNSNSANDVMVPLTSWLVCVRRGDNNEDDGVVLYRPGEGGWKFFNTRQELTQYLDMNRMGQDLAWGMAPGRRHAPDAERSLPQVAMEIVSPRDRQALQQFFSANTDQPGDLSRHLQFIRYPGTHLNEGIHHWAGEQLDGMADRLRPLVAAPELERQLAVAAALEQRYASFVEKDLPPLREFTRRQESAKLVEGLRKGNALTATQTLDADSVFIDFNGYNMSWTDWVQEGFRGHGDQLLAYTNNFMADARISVNDPNLTTLENTQLAQLLNGRYKESVQQNMRGTYAGDKYIQNLQQRLNPNDQLGQEFRELNVASTLAQLRVTLEAEHANGRINGAHYGWMKPLVDALPVNTSAGSARLGDFRIDGLRIPGVSVLSRPWEHRQAQNQNSVFVQRDAFVLLPHGPYGSELMPLAQYQQLLKTPAYRDDVDARVRDQDRARIDKALAGVRNDRAVTEPISNFSAFCNLRLQDWIDNADERTTSRNEMIWEQVLKGGRFMTAALCIAGTGGLASVPCALGTGILMGVDIKRGLENLQRGEHVAALLDVAFLGFDALDIGIGVRAMMPSKLLHWAGKTRFESVAEVEQALKTMRQQSTAFTSSGRLNPDLAHSEITRDMLTKMQSPPRMGGPGTFYEYGGRTFIRDQGQVFEVYSQNGWGTVRLRDPRRPDGLGAPVAYRMNQWLADGGLYGGSPQEMLTEAHWLKGFTTADIAEMEKPNFWTKFSNKPGTVPRTPDNILSKTGPELLTLLDEKALVSVDTLSLFRAMKPAEADGIMDWYTTQKDITENWVRGGQASAKALHQKAVPGTGIIPLSNHLGDKNQALHYLNKDSAAVMLEFKLKPGAELVLFTPEYLAIARSGRGAPRAMVSKLGNAFPEASKNEGVLPGYIGVKSEKHGPFSLSLGTSDASRLLLQLMVDSIVRVNRTPIG